jgi:hypothetical protein
MNNYYTSNYTFIKNTGIGAANIPWCGRHIIFDDDGNYPKNTFEYLISKQVIKIKRLKKKLKNKIEN